MSCGEIWESSLCLWEVTGTCAQAETELLHSSSVCFDEHSLLCPVLQSWIISGAFQASFKQAFSPFACSFKSTKHSLHLLKSQSLQIQLNNPFAEFALNPSQYLNPSRIQVPEHFHFKGLILTFYIAKLFSQLMIMMKSSNEVSSSELLPEQWEEKGGGHNLQCNLGKWILKLMNGCFIKPIPHCCIHLSTWEECNWLSALLMRVKPILKSLSVSLGKGGTTCMFLLITVFYSVLIAVVVGCAGHFRKCI